MPQITLKVPKLVEQASEAHPDLGRIIEDFTDADRNKFAQAASLCEEWISPEFMKLLSELQLEGRLPSIDINIDATVDSRRVLTYSAPEGSTNADVRGLIQRAWIATINTYAGALFSRSEELATGNSTPDWTPDEAVSSPTL